MSRIGAIFALTLAAAALSGPAETWAVSYRITPDSQQLGPANASAGASVRVSTPTPGAPGGSGGGATPVNFVPSGEASSSARGGGFTYTKLNGESCQYVPNLTPCYGVTPAGQTTPEPRPAAPGAPAQPPINPGILAATVAGRIPLGLGQIQASPSTQTAGLTGAASWFWIEPAPTTRSLSVSLHGEQVTVSASAASVQWSFGDSSELVAGPGVPYRPGTAPAGAVRHVYQTRCLPGDQGHDPNVLSSCGPDGYTVEALVQWAISYTAAGPVAGYGTLPSRSTATSIAYPVSEARAFLTAAGGEG